MNQQIYLISIKTKLPKKIKLLLENICIVPVTNFFVIIYWLYHKSLDL